MTRQPLACFVVRILRRPPTPLLPNEVKATAKSVAKWTWSRFDVAASDARFSALQGYRGRKGGNASGIARASHRMDRLQKMMSISL
ncbi:MAG: primase C-terminal domain-containing protein [Acidovorax sp.]|nr:primase C-terminal domain-containing protein [Acidovorax sp.]